MPNRFGESDEALAVAECDLCDARGVRRGFACDHVDWAGAAKRGMAMIRQAMGWTQ